MFRNKCADCQGTYENGSHEVWARSPYDNDPSAGSPTERVKLCVSLPSNLFLMRTDYILGSFFHQKKKKKRTHHHLVCEQHP
jgi:hypothetical protein